MRIKINEYIVADSKICHGQLTFNGTRIMVWQILEMVEGGMTAEDIIEDYPSLTKEHIKAALRYAADLTRGSDDVTVKIPLKA